MITHNYFITCFFKILRLFWTFKTFQSSIGVITVDSAVTWDPLETFICAFCLSCKGFDRLVQLFTNIGPWKLLELVLLCLSLLLSSVHAWVTTQKKTVTQLKISLVISFFFCRIYLVDKFKLTVQNFNYASNSSCYLTQLCT